MVADLAKGEYDYLIEKTYPNGRVETYSDKVKVVSVDNNQIATFDSANAKFINNWIINESSYAKGTYKYKFQVDKVVREFEILVTDRQFMSVDQLSIGTNNLSSFDGSYTASLSQIVGTPSITKFTLSELTTANFYEVTAQARVKQVDAQQGFVAAKSILATAPVGKISLLDKTKLDLGPVTLLPGYTVPVAGEYVDYTVRFFTYNASTLVYSGVGNATVFTVMVNDNPDLARPTFTLSTDGQVAEGREIGEVLTLRVQNAQFDSNADLKAEIILDEGDRLAGIGDADYTLNVIDANTVQLVLTANATTAYTTDVVHLQVRVDKEALKDDGTAELAYAASYIARTPLVKTPVTVALGTLEALGAETGKTFTITLRDYKFKSSLDPAKFVLTANSTDGGAKAGSLAVQTVVRDATNDSKVTVTLSAHNNVLTTDVLMLVTINADQITDLNGNSTSLPTLVANLPRLNNAVTASVLGDAGVIVETLEKGRKILLTLSGTNTFTETTLDTDIGVAGAAAANKISIAGLPTITAGSAAITFTAKVKSTKTVEIEFTQNSQEEFTEGNITITIDDAATSAAVDLIEKVKIFDRLQTVANTVILDSADTPVGKGANNTMAEADEEDEILEITLPANWTVNASIANNITSFVKLTGLTLKAANTPIAFYAVAAEGATAGVYDKIRIFFTEDSDKTLTAGNPNVVDVVITKEILLLNGVAAPRNLLTTFDIAQTA
jgi:hypothetical protein